MKFRLKEKVETKLYLKNAVFLMWRCVDLVRTDVSEERVASIFSLEKIHEREKY
jgi:hypothetical protein